MHTCKRNCGVHINTPELHIDYCPAGSTGFAESQLASNPFPHLLWHLNSLCCWEHPVQHAWKLTCLCNTWKVVQIYSRSLHILMKNEASNRGRREQALILFHVLKVGFKLKPMFFTNVIMLRTTMCFSKSRSPLHTENIMNR